MPPRSRPVGRLLAVHDALGAASVRIAFAPEGVRVEAYGNVLASISFLHGLTVDDLRREELDLRDPDYEMLVAIRAQKVKREEPLGDG